MPEILDKLLEEHKIAITDVFEQHKVRIILYGSYARVDFKIDSDIDIMMLADITPEEICCYREKIYDITYEFEIKYNVEINPIVQCRKDYEQWKKIYPFYMNVEKEGIVVYGEETNNCTIYF